MKAKLWIMLLLTGAGAGAFAAEIFKTVDEQGNVVFSDVPPPPSREDDAERVQVEPLNTFEPAVPEATAAAPEEPEVPDVARYESVTIVAPANEETVRENAGNVSVAVALQPPLRAGDRLVLFMDGLQWPVVAQGNSFSLENIDRGTHTVGVRVLDGEGNVAAESEPTTFHLVRYRLPRPAPRS
jgi:hypothetical protein